MENKEKSPEQELVESIGLMMEKGMSSSDKILTGIIKSVDGKKAKVDVNGQEQTVSICTPELLVGAISRVFVPNNNMSNAFIIGKAKESEVVEPVVKIATGVYSGTGTYGASNPNRLNFDFTPKAIFFQEEYYSSSNSKWYINRYSNGTMMLYGTLGILYNNASVSESITWGNNYISWYNTTNAMYQLNNNTNQNRYRYLAIGIKQ